MLTTKPAPAAYPILAIIQNRWSPLAFSSRPVEKEKIASLLEAARWAPSSFNEQPWSYIVGHFGDDVYAKLSDCLVEGNSWARNAGVLMLSVAKTNFSHNDKPNRFFMHDVGAASAYLVLQATELDLVTHQMEGFDLDKARKYFNIPSSYDPGSIIAVGYPGNADELPDQWKQRESSDRSRKTIEEMIWK